MTTLDHYDFCKPYISDNEYILWEGAPEKGFTFTSRDLVMIPFSLFWLAFALFWEFSAITSTSSLFMAIWGLPFVGVGIYLCSDALSSPSVCVTKPFISSPTKS